MVKKASRLGETCWSQDLA